MTSTIGAAETLASIEVVDGGGRAGGAAPSAILPEPPRSRRSWAWLGLIPFVSFVFIFLVLPAIGVVDKATVLDGERTLKPLSDALSQEQQAFWNSIKLSLISALVGVVIGGLLTYAVATAKRPKWLRTLVTSFSGVGANMGGVILAFMFITLIGRTGVATKILKWAGWDLYAGDFKLANVAGLVTVYLYFQIPLMFLVTLPAVDGLKQSWREAAQNLGATSVTYWRRVGLPVLAPSLLGGFLLLFANSFSAFATAFAIGTGTNIVPIKIRFFLQGDVATGGPVPFALATWMIIFMVISMGGYMLLRRYAERWRR